MRSIQPAFLSLQTTRWNSLSPFSALPASNLQYVVGGSNVHFGELLSSGNAVLKDVPLETSLSVYEPIVPSTETLLGMGLIIFLCAVVAWVWQNQVVPTARTNLAISKSRGPVKQYLDELRESDPRKYQENGLVIDSIDDSVKGGVDRQLEELESRHSNDNRAIERWLFTDWLRDNKSERRAGRQKEPALPILKDAKWNSGDNPILAATLLIGLGVFFTAITERITSLTS